MSHRRMSHKLFFLLALSFAVACGGGDDDGGPQQPDAAPDSDNDFIPDHIEGEGDPDGDGIPNYLDEDSDGDTIRDSAEGSADFDGDTIPNFLDLDSDQDCISDADEAGDTDLATPPVNSDQDDLPDAYDLDKDGDGLSDIIEDPNCNGIQDEGETSAINDDTDGDGVSDLIEVADQDCGEEDMNLCSDPLDPDRNPQARGDFVFVVPYEEATEPVADDLDFETNLKQVDVYFLLDRSSSMSNELDSLRDNIVSVMSSLACSDPAAGCIPDLQAGAGGIGYPAADGEAFKHLIDIQGDNAALASALSASNLDEPGCDGQENLANNRPCDETTQVTLWSALSGDGRDTIKSKVGTELTCPDHDGQDGRREDDPPAITVPFNTLFQSDYPDRSDFGGGPCAEGRSGYPCFRNDSLPVVIFATDESSDVTVNCPLQTDLAALANSMGAKLVGLAGGKAESNLINEMKAIATATGAIDITSSSAPLIVEVERGNESETATKLEAAIRVLANGVPLEISATALDDPTDVQDVDAVASFIDRLETLQTGEGCTSGLTEVDSNSDSFPDTYQQVSPGNPVCWSLVAKMNTTVEALEVPQIFKATIEVRGNDVTKLDDRDVWFLVPPVLRGEIVN